jgi:glyoxylase-like metal-dependent hydrolase (beta-lactamase superfamily II)
VQFSLDPFEQVADRVYVATAEPASVNIGLVVGSERALVIDTGSSPQLGRRILAAAREIAGDIPVSHVVVTHYHWDHLFGLAGFDGLTSFGHAAIEDDLRANPQLEAELADLGLTEEDIVLPQNTFELAASIDLGDARAEIVHFGRGHTSSDVVVFIPERRVVFVGDLLESANPPSIGPDTHLKDWPFTLDGTLGTLRAPTVIVPGHGPMMDRESAFIQRAELRFIWEQAEILYKQGVELHEAAKATDSWPWDEDSVRSALPFAYSELERSGVQPDRRRLKLL